jgi:hypothetical protein
MRECQHMGKREPRKEDLQACILAYYTQCGSEDGKPKFQTSIEERKFLIL